jgi:SHS family lactate transporter-like MFS transporter
MVSSASAQIESTGANANPKPNPRYPGPNQKPTIPGYALVSAILLGVTCAYILVVISFGKEYRGAAFENAPTAIMPNAGKVGVEDIEQVGATGVPVATVHRTDSDSEGSQKEEADYEKK